MLKLRVENKEKCEKYKKSVEATNALILKRQAYYNSLVETMLQLEQSRIGLAKSLISKYINLMERTAKIFAEKSNVLSASLASVRSEDDIRNFQASKANHSNNIAFSPTKFIQYDSEYNYWFNHVY